MGRRITTYKAEVGAAEQLVRRSSFVLSALGIHQHLKDEDELYCRLTLILNGDLCKMPFVFLWQTRSSH